MGRVDPVATESGNIIFGGYDISSGNGHIRTPPMSSPVRNLILAFVPPRLNPSLLKAQFTDTNDITTDANVWHDSDDVLQ